MKFYNTLNRKTEDFKAIKSEVVSLYTCGPTVYDYAHIGNLRAFIFDDTLRRVLEASNYQVNHVMNITDVGHLVSDDDEGEDKLEKGALREGKTVWDVAKHYTDAFLSDMKALNILHPNGNNNHYAKATDFIDQQATMVQQLLDKGFAYQTKQAIYFDVTKLADYGKLSGQKLEEKTVGARDEVITDADKKHPYDFAVWFFATGRFKDHSMRWPSPWGQGFPGWHLECSAIIHATLGEPIDIHTGGVDHIGTHHTNEIAQTEAAFGKSLANYWLHNEHLLVDDKKMSKSLGNFYTLDGLVKKSYNPLAFRLLMLQSHYRSQANFSWDALTAAQNSLHNFQQWSDLQFQNLTSEALTKSYQQDNQTILENLQNDLATPEALSVINQMVNKVDRLGADSAAVAESAKLIDSLLGLKLLDRQDITTEQRELLNQRQVSRDRNEWAKADEIRTQLEGQGIGIKDTSQKQVWFRS